MKLIYFIILIFLILGVSHAEKIDGPANIRNISKDTTLFTLHNQVEVECSESKNNWFKVLVRVALTYDDIIDNNFVKENTTLLDLDGNVIGLWTK